MSRSSDCWDFKATWNVDIEISRASQDSRTPVPRSEAEGSFYLTLAVQSRTQVLPCASQSTSRPSAGLE